MWESVQGLRRLFALAGKFADGWWTEREEGIEGAWAVLKAVVPFSQCMCGRGGGFTYFLFLICYIFRCPYLIKAYETIYLNRKLSFRGVPLRT